MSDRISRSYKRKEEARIIDFLEVQAKEDKTICVRCGLEAYDEIDHRGVCIDCNISENTLERERDHYLEEEIE